LLFCGFTERLSRVHVADSCCFAVSQNACHVYRWRKITRRDCMETRDLKIPLRFYTSLAASRDWASHPVAQALGGSLQLATPFNSLGFTRWECGKVFG
jgi:hypothetical protein